ncbi:MAG: hypothetical protein H6702_03300 [Myxococcales bacterium]|nr:hypothetical protein [Myxococcales bacterium]
MNRVALAVVALAAVAALLWFGLSKPVTGRPAGPAPTVAVVEADAAPQAPAPPLQRPATAPPSVAAVAPPPAAADAGMEPDAAGPPSDRYDLGDHVVRLRTPEGSPPMELVIQVVVRAQGEALREVRLRRRQLIRMLFFLGSHRQADGALGAEGQDRFKADLLARYRNVVRSGEVEDLEFPTWRVQPVPAGAAGADEPGEPDEQ